VQPDYDGLVVNPCIPNEWDGFKITRKFRGTTFNIEVLNPNHISKGVKELWIDDVKTEGNKIPVQNKKECKVKIIMGCC
jgi:cellobiose phosphorylase